MRHPMLTLAALFAAGCSGQAPQSAAGPRAAFERPAAAAVKVDRDAAPEPALQARPAGGNPAPPPAADPATPRMVVHTAAVELVVKDVAAAQAEIDRVVDAAKGYIAKADVSGKAGGRTTATWTLKVPVAQYRPTLAKVAALGVVVKQTADSQDVTEEFSDTAAKVKSLKAEEEVLQRLLKEAVGRLDDIIKVREQIKAVRLDIDRAEGRMQFLGATAALSTITVTAREDEAYTPPPLVAPPPPPAFGETLAGTFDASVGVLTGVGKAVLVALAAAAPWLPLALATLLLTRWAWRRATRPGFAA